MFKLSDFQTDLKRDDKITLAKLIHTPFLRGYVYDKDGNSFEVDSKVRVVCDKDNTLSVFNHNEVFIIPNENEEGDFYYLEHYKNKKLILR